MALSYYLARALAWLLFLLFARWQVEGRENIPSKGPLILVSNHVSFADPPLLSLCIRRRIVFMAKIEAYRSLLQGPFVRSYKAFPVRRLQLDREALRQAEQVLGKGLILGMFPEGTRSRDARMQPAYSGTSFVALRTGVSILPVGITGTEKVKLGSLLGRHRVKVNIGEPFQLPPTAGRLTRDKLEEGTDIIMRRIAELLPQGYRGGYTADNKEESRIGD